MAEKPNILRKNMTHEIQKDLTASLRQFTGGGKVFRSWLPTVVYTEGIQHLAREAGAYWLIDAIIAHFPTKKMAAAQFEDYRVREAQYWRLKVDCNDSAILSAEADAGEKPFIVQKIPFTDFPLEKVEIWAELDGQRWTLLLPSEH